MVVIMEIMDKFDLLFVGILISFKKFLECYVDVKEIGLFMGFDLEIIWMLKLDMVFLMKMLEVDLKVGFEGVDLKVDFLDFMSIVLM